MTKPLVWFPWLSQFTDGSHSVIVFSTILFLKLVILLRSLGLWLLQLHVICYSLIIFRYIEIRKDVIIFKNHQVPSNIKDLTFLVVRYDF